MTQDASCWTLPDEGFAELRVGAISTRVNLERPCFGFCGVHVEDQFFDEMTARLLVISPQEDPPVWRARLVDRYVRGNDLVATYSGYDSWPYAPQIYWCAEPMAAGGAALGAISIVVSIQTGLLDTHPTMFVRSDIPADELLMVRASEGDTLVESSAEGSHSPILQKAACAIVWRLPGGKLSYAEIMPTSDYSHLKVWRGGPGYVARWQLFAEFLEKGVIRRARIQSLFLPRENDLELAAECCRALENRPLPLTT